MKDIQMIKGSSRGELQMKIAHMQIGDALWVPSHLVGKQTTFRSKVHNAATDRHIKLSVSKRGAMYQGFLYKGGFPDGGMYITRTE